MVSIMWSRDEVISDMIGQTLRWLRKKLEHGSKSWVVLRTLNLVGCIALHCLWKPALRNVGKWNLWRRFVTRSSADADNGLDAFSGQSTSTNMVPFHMLHTVSYCAIVTSSLRRGVFMIFDFKKCHDLEMGVKVTQGHWEWYHSIDCVWFPISVL